MQGRRGFAAQRRRHDEPQLGSYSINPVKAIERRKLLNNGVGRRGELRYFKLAAASRLASHRADGSLVSSELVRRTFALKRSTRMRS
jgi:hypothetical protein